LNAVTVVAGTGSHPLMFAPSWLISQLSQFGPV
jgi:hypothetical protein